MGTRKFSERHVRNITKNSSGTASVSLPVDFINELGWRTGQKVVVYKKGEQLVIKDWSPDK